MYIEDQVNNLKWISGYKQTKAGRICIVKTLLSASDTIDAWAVRWGIRRMNRKIEPGLYAVGNPDKSDAVFVTANFKLSFDALRKELSELNAWILVLDTKGINVWCAAGKGTFGTQELINRIRITKLKSMVNHKTLILPQLGATGVSAHDVKKAIGFKIVYGPVRSKDIKAFLMNGLKKDRAMRTIDFNLKDRFVLTPIEFVHSLPCALIILGLLFLIHIIKFQAVTAALLLDYIPFLGAILLGTVISPLLLPFIPVRSFALKGVVLGILWAVFISLVFNLSYLGLFINLLLLTPLVSFLTLNFTGNSTYTSLTGVKIEVKVATPLFIISGVIGITAKLLFMFDVIRGI
ncbi:MAG: hypothetical protein JW822_10025 [Spirochaetales bacterium]|nr:hypothetical protein [Spirochaetales bacterium]